jgi:ubiquinone/menaquinone biosynthesis C-methylase UbiE
MKQIEQIAPAEQYNQWAEEHDALTLKYDGPSRASFYSLFTFETEGKKLLDIACGSGHDLKHYQDSMKCDSWGVDASEAEVKIANQRVGEGKVQLGHANALPYKNESFDIVTCKYAPQGFDSIADFYKETDRVLKSGGYLLILTTHPMRHFLEKVEKPRDYFKKEIVVSWIYDHTLPLQEYSHTMNDYLSSFFLERFSLEKYLEEFDPTGGCVQHVDGEKYPAYFLYRAKKK